MITALTLPKGEGSSKKDLMNDILQPPSPLFMHWWSPYQR